MENEILEIVRHLKKESESKPPKRLLFWVNITLIFANLAIFIGIFLAISSYFLDRDNYTQQREFAIRVDKVNNAMNAINRFYNPDFIKSCATIRTPELKDSTEYRDAENNVFNSYYVISLIYKSGIADSLIIGNAIVSELGYYINHEPFINIEECKEKTEIIEMYSSIVANTK